MNPLLLALLAFFCFTWMDLSIKWLLATYPLLQVTFFNGLFAMAGLLIWIYPRFSVLKTTLPWVHFARASTVLVGDLLAFYSFGKVTLAEAYTLILTQPLFIVMVAALLRYEVFTPKRLWISLIGFSGIYLVLKPGFGVFEVALLAALGCAVVETLGFLLITGYRHSEPPEVFAFYGLGLLTLVSGVGTVFYYQPMQWLDLGISFAGGTCYALASALVVLAFHRGLPSAVSSMQYSQLVWGMLLAFLIWGELPDGWALVGAALITGASIWLLFLPAQSVEKEQFEKIP